MSSFYQKLLGMKTYNENFFSYLFTETYPYKDK